MAKSDSMARSAMSHKNHVCSFYPPSHTLSDLCAGIFSSSIKNNILFGKDYNHKLFKRVIDATALSTVRHSIIDLPLYLSRVQDLTQLLHGVNTLVGDQGVMLSGVSSPLITLR